MGTPGIDTSRLTHADRIVLGAAGLFFVWTLVPAWYSCCSTTGAHVASNGLRGVLIVAWLLSIGAIAEIVLTRIVGTSTGIPVARGALHVAIAAAASLLVLVGIVAKGAGLSLSWGYLGGVAAAISRTYGAAMMASQPTDTPDPGPPSSGGRPVG